jgi:hypothetical protein
MSPRPNIFTEQPGHGLGYRRNPLQVSKPFLGVLALGAITVGGLALAAPVSAATPGRTTVETLVHSLHSEGYTVIVNRAGSAPLSQCTVAAVRPGQTYATVDSRGGGSLKTTVTAKTVYVDAAC